MATSLTNLFNFGRPLPKPFDKLPSKKLKGVASKYGGVEATLCAPVIKAVHALCVCQNGGEGAVGQITSTLSVAEYKSSMGPDAYHLVVYDSGTGSLLASVYDRNTELIEQYTVHTSARDGAALFFAMMPQLLEDEEFRENWKAYQEQFTNGFSDLPKATHNMAILCDNAYRRIKDSACPVHLKVNVDKSGNLMRVSRAQLDSGLYQPTEGKIFLNGKEVRIDSPAQAVKLGIGMVHQHFMLVEAMTVFENIILGDRNTKGIFIDKEARKKEILELAERYGLDVELDRPITEIAVGAQQRVEILKTLYRGAELLILDEPTAALTDIEVEGLFQIINKLTEEGKSVIFISHKMREVLQISDRITILRTGEVITTLDRSETDGQELANLMIGRELVPSHYGKVEEPGDPVIQMRSVDYHKESKHAGLSGVSLTVGRGEIVGIAGVDGNGQSQLAQVVTGVLTPDAAK